MGGEGSDQREGQFLEPGPISFGFRALICIFSVIVGRFLFPLVFALNGNMLSFSTKQVENITCLYILTVVIAFTRKDNACISKTRICRERIEKSSFRNCCVCLVS